MDPKHPKRTHNWYENNKNPLPLLPCIAYPANIHGKSRAYWCNNKNKINISRSEFRQKNGQNKVNNNNFPEIYTLCTTFKIKGFCPKLWIKAEHGETLKSLLFWRQKCNLQRIWQKIRIKSQREPTHAIWDNGLFFVGLWLQCITRGPRSSHKCFFAFVHEVIVCEKS